VEERYVAIFTGTDSNTTGCFDDAAVRIRSDSSTKALMAEQILRAAAHGVHHQDELSQIAVKAATGSSMTLHSRFHRCNRD
jgi:hypothetical protein